MAVDPKKWTIKTQEAWRRRSIRRGRCPTRSSRPITCWPPSRRQDDTLTPAVLQKLGLAPLMVRNKADEAVAEAAQGLRRRRPADEPRADQRVRERRAVPQGPEGRLPLRRAPAAGDEPAPRHRQRGAAAGAEGGPRQPPRHQPVARRSSSPRWRSTARTSPPAPATARSTRSSAATTRSAASSRCSAGARRTTRC